LCKVCEGDINEYWLNSIKHGSSCQPFYPTWILSAYIVACIAKNFNYKELVDIGSGDGRIAYCAKILDMKATSIEIDDVLVELQNNIVDTTKLDFNPICADAIDFDYLSLNLSRPVIFIGGLPQMGGDVLATNIIEKISKMNLKINTSIVLAGTFSKRHLSDNLSNGGWNSLIDKHQLKVIKSVSLPTIWTFDQSIDTPYIFTKFS
jgi:16S rRNA A1518/A1519 N6-dimethyltransferase RsmA/KsgA/DIM1 with predicted DNA glycosylase/AP lyase activity